jgi:hypothetical protein
VHYMEEREIILQLRKQTAGYPRSHFDHALRAKAEEIARSYTEDELWSWARANSLSVELELSRGAWPRDSFDLSLPTFFRRVLHKTLLADLRSAADWHTDYDEDE